MEALISPIPMHWDQTLLSEIGEAKPTHPNWECLHTYQVLFIPKHAHMLDLLICVKGIDILRVF
jgi:hypothetical protein